MDTLICTQCSSPILPRQHNLVCTSCGIAAHRTCFPSISNQDYFTFKQDWKCGDCVPIFDLLTSNFSQLEVTLFNTSAEFNIANSTSETLSLQDIQDNQDHVGLRLSKGLKIGHMNVNSIRNKFDDIVALLANYSLDIVGFTESKLDPDRDQDAMFMIDGYNFIRHDRDCNKGGGTIVYFKAQLNLEVVEHPIIMYKDYMYLS